MKEFKVSVSITDGEEEMNLDFIVEAETIEEAYDNLRSDLDI